jgi:hypothetical protein
LTAKKLLRGYLDRLRENLDTLDEEIENARVMSKSKKSGERQIALQWAKTLRDLVEMRNVTLEKIKVHLLGRNENGVANEPSDCWDGNSDVMYERYFKQQMRPWTLDDLKLTCEDCGRCNEDVATRRFPAAEYYLDDEYAGLCSRCYEKRLVKATREIEEETEESDLSGEDSEEVAD